MKFNITGKIAIILAISIICSIYAQSPCSGNLAEPEISGQVVHLQFIPDNPSEALTYHWDPNGDGTIDTITTVDSLVWEYEAGGSMTSSLQVVSYDDTCSYSKEINVSEYRMEMIWNIDSLEEEGFSYESRYRETDDGIPFLSFWKYADTIGSIDVYYFYVDGSYDKVYTTAIGYPKPKLENGRIYTHYESVLVDSSEHHYMDSVYYEYDYRRKFRCTEVKFDFAPENNYLIDEEYFLFKAAFDYDWGLVETPKYLLSCKDTSLEESQYAITKDGDLRFFTPEMDSLSYHYFPAFISFCKRIENKLITLLTEQNGDCHYFVYDTTGMLISHEVSFYEINKFTRSGNYVGLFSRNDSTFIKMNNFDSSWVDFISLNPKENHYIDLFDDLDIAAVVYAEFNDGESETVKMICRLYETNDSLVLLDEFLVADELYDFQFSPMEDSTFLVYLTRLDTLGEYYQQLEVRTLFTNEIQFVWPNPAITSPESFAYGYIIGEYYFTYPPYGFRFNSGDMPQKAFYRIIKGE